MTSSSPNKAWEDYSAGVHFGAACPAPPNDGTVATVENIVDALIAEDIAGDAAAADCLNALVPPSDPPLAFWLEVEKAYFCDLTGSNLNKWKVRVARLATLVRPLSSTPTWLETMAHGRRDLLHATCAGRTDTPIYREVNELLAKADEMFSHASDDFGIGLTQTVRGRLMGWQGKIDSASEALSSALAIFSTLGNRFRIADVAYELGGSYRDLRRYDVAEPLHQLVVRIGKEHVAPAAHARALQALSATLIGLAEQPGEIRAQRLSEARGHAFESFAMSTRCPDQLDPQALVDLNRVEPSGDVFRAAMAALDMAEIALKQDNMPDAEKWFLVACAEFDIDVSSIHEQGKTLFGEFAAPGYAALREMDLSQARMNATSQTKYGELRLAKIEARLGSGQTLDEASIVLEQLGRLWELRGEAPHAVDSYLHAAEMVNKFESADGANGRPARANATRIDGLRYLALRRAEAIGLNTQSSTLSEAFVSDGPLHLASVAAQATPVQLLNQEQNVRVYRVLTKQHSKPMRLTVTDDNWLVSRYSGLLPGIARLSRDRHGLPTIENFGIEDNQVWVLDELLLGRSLVDILRGPLNVEEAFSVLGQLAHTVRALHETGVECVLLDPTNIVVQPGHQPVLVRYAPLFTQYQDIVSEMSLYVQGKVHRPTDDVRALARMCVLWLGGHAYHPLSKAEKVYRRRRFWTSKRDPIDRVRPDLAMKISKALTLGDDAPDLGALGDALLEEVNHLP